MSINLQKGLRKISEAQSAVISHEVTEKAQRALLVSEAENERGAEI